MNETGIAIEVTDVCKKYRIKKTPDKIEIEKDKKFKMPEVMKTFRKSIFPDYAVIHALRGISFNIKQGDAVGIIGGNGSGKSTLLKLLSRVTEPSNGVIRVAGTLGALLEVGAGFHPELTGRENIFLSGSLLGMNSDVIKARFKDIVEFSGVGPFLDTPVKRYSSGMHVRLGFSVAAHLEPDILLVDEVLAVGDASFQQQCLSKLQSLQSDGRTILFVSHNMGLVELLCTRAVFLEKGNLAYEGECNETISRYLDSLEANQSSEIEYIKNGRAGNGEIRFKEIIVHGNRYRRTATLISGESADFSFELTERSSDLECSFGIYDHSGIPITLVHSKNISKTGKDIISTKMSKVFTCSMDELLLVPGKYRLDVCLTRNGVLLDSIDGALFFKVISGSSDGRSISNCFGYGSVYFPHQWRIN